MSKAPKCPFLNKPCIEHDCMLYTHVTMLINPQTGASEDKWGCSFGWIPLLIIESSNQTRHAAASVDSMRNEIIKRMDNHEADRMSSTERLYGPVRTLPQIGDDSSD